VTNDIPVRIVRALRYRDDSRWNHPGMIYPYNTVYFVLGGDGHIRAGDAITDMQPGWAYLIPAHLRHDVWCDTAVEKAYVDVHAELLPGTDLFSGRQDIGSLFLGLERCQSIYNACEGGMRERLILRGELMLVLAGFMNGEPSAVSARMRDFLPMIEDMQQHLSARIRRNEIAAKYGWNPSALSRAFRQVFGCGIKQYVEKLLVARLAEDLLLTDKTLQQLAAEYGFCDAYYLSAFFKRHIGLSPAIYRQRNRQDLRSR